MLKDAARLWSGHAAAKSLTLAVDIAQIPEWIVTDGGRLRQILFNLLSNAVKFTPAGTIELRATVEELAGGTMLAIAVSDTGVGIPDDQQALVFDAFHQVDGGTTRQFSGTGLGLAICRNLATTLGGSLELHSALGIGSTFTLRLPLVLAERAPGRWEREEHRRPAALCDASLLVVEQNAVAQGILRTVFEPHAATITIVENGDQALAELTTGCADHLLIEANSATVGAAAPVSSLRRLVDAANAAGVSTTILFAASEDLPIAELAQIGATQLVMKPVGGRQLVQSLCEGYAEANAAAAPIPIAEAA